MAWNSSGEQRFVVSVGPKNAWLAGSGTELLAKGQPRAYQEWSVKYGPGPVGATLFSETVVLVSDPNTARQLLLHGSYRPITNNKSVLPKQMREDNVTSLLWSRGDQWKSLRAIWQPFFFTSSLEGYVGIMDKCAQFLVEEMLQAAAHGQIVNVMSSIQDMTLNVIGQAAFGVDLHTQKNDTTQQTKQDRAKSSRVREAAQMIFAPATSSLWVLLVNLFPFLLPLVRTIAYKYPDKPLPGIDPEKATQPSPPSSSSVQKVVLDSRMAVFDTVEELIREHRASLKADSVAVPIRTSTDSNASKRTTTKPVVVGPAHSSFDNASGELSKSGAEEPRRGVQPGSFIDLLVKASDRATGQALSDSVIAQQAATMMLAGFETTASTLTFAAYLLAKPCNAEKQEKLIAEVDALGDGFAPNRTDLEEKLPYMDAVLKETLRLFPPAHTLTREAERDMTIGGCEVKKGQWLLVPAFSIHNDSKNWGPDAASFVPERWLDSDSAAVKRAKNTFFAFGAGSRVCPGSRFALTEAKTTLVRLFQRCKLELAPNHEEPLKLQATITMSAKNGVKVQPVARL